MRHLGRDTTPELGTCARCLATVLRAWVDGLHTTATLHPLTLTGQLHALTAGRWLYELHLRARPELLHRDHYRIASGRTHIAIPEHHCDDQWKAHLDEPAWQRIQQWRKPPPRKPANNRPPF